MPLDFVSSVLVSTGLTGALSALAYRRNVLTWDGSLAAFVVGMVIGVFGDVTWLFLLLLFLLSSFLATRYRFALKEALGVQEGLRGERKATNVVANGFAPMAVAAISLTMPPGFPKIMSGIVFLSALAVAGADTLASEIGVLSRRTVLITTGRPVPPGTDGGVSPLGQLCAIGAALYTSIVGWFVLSNLARMWNLIPTMPPAPVCADPNCDRIPRVSTRQRAGRDPRAPGPREQEDREPGLDDDRRDRGLPDPRRGRAPTDASASARSGVRPSAYTRKIGSVPDGLTRTAPSASTIFTPSVVSTFRPFVSSTRDARTASRRSTGTETFVFLR